MLHFESVVLCDPMMYSQEIDEGPFIVSAMAIIPQIFTITFVIAQNSWWLR